MIAKALFTYIYDKAFIYQSIATITTYFSLRIFFFIRARKSIYQIFKYHGIPGPEPSLLDGNLRELQKNDTPFIVEEQMAKKYGKCYGIFIGDEPSLIITDLDMLKKIFIDDTTSFKERTRLFLDVPLAEGILFTKYPRWKFMRKAMSPVFGRFTMREVPAADFIERSVKLTLEYINNKVEQNDTKTADIDISDLMKSTALHLITSLSISLPDVQVKENEENVKNLDNYLRTVDNGVILFTIRFPIMRPFIQFLANRFEHSKTLGLIYKHLNNKIDQTLKSIRIHNSESISPEQIQLIDLLIKLHHEGKMTRKEILGNAEALLFAGYDTTSTTLTYISWVLAKYPSIQKELRDEIKAHGVESKLLERVINETMRLYPTVVTFTTRLATRTVEINNWTIPQGTCVVYNSWLMHHDADLWPNPEVFDPNRFKEGTVIHPCAFAPFGLGERRCIGYKLALLEMKMVICDLLLSYELELKSPQTLDLIAHATALTQPKEKVILKLRKLEL